MIDKLLLKETMLKLEADRLAYVKQSYIDFLQQSAPDFSEATDHDQLSQRFNAAEMAQAFECPLHNYEEAIASINATDFGNKTDVRAGAVIEIDGRSFVVAVATAPFICQGHIYMGLSTQAPIFKCLEGKRAGESCHWAGLDIRLDCVS